MLDTVRTCGCMNRPDWAGIKFIAEGATVRAGTAGATPVPDKAMAPGPVALLMTPSDAARAPAAVGWKATPTEQLAPEARLVPLTHVEPVIVKSSALAPDF